MSLLLVLIEDWQIKTWCLFVCLAGGGEQVAASVDRVRGHSSKEDLEKSFSPLVKFNLGLAPSQGLYLERVLYSTYNTQ